MDDYTKVPWAHAWKLILAAARARGTPLDSGRPAEALLLATSYMAARNMNVGGAVSFAVMQVFDCAEPTQGTML